MTIDEKIAHCRRVQKAVEDACADGRDAWRENAERHGILAVFVPDLIAEIERLRAEGRRS